jgi:Tol biopolymer transport system component
VRRPVPARLFAPLPVLICLLAFVSSAEAIYGPAAGGLGADIVSVDRAADEQADAPTSDAAISADGRYVVFQTRATNFFENDGVADGDPEPPGILREGGIFRYDRTTGELALVADGSETHENDHSLVFRGAQNPSVSADGRYIAFSTAQQLVPQDTNENVDVYVRDMNVPLDVDRKSSGAYKLVSAKTGGEEPASYATREPPLPGANPGADVWPNTAISANGRYVVFRTPELASDLPDHAAVDTPPGNLFVRDLSAKTTTLISRTSVGHEPEECGTSPTSAGGEPACGATGPATISADGSTVAWVGSRAVSQTAFLVGESPQRSTPYYLWRRWQEPTAPTRRITGIADPEDPACPSGGEVTLSSTATGPCYGPLSEQESDLASIAGVAPGLSADGYTVAFLVGAALRPNITKSTGLDVFLTSMRPDITRKAGTRELTLAVSSGAQGSTPSIESLALSQDGSTIAFTTPRDSFVLPEPLPTGAFRPLPTASDLYVIHLAANTLERAVVSYEGGDPNRSVSVGPTLTENGSTLAFVSSASNLTFGDANSASDAFSVTFDVPGGTAAPPAGVNAGSGGFSLTALSSPELGVSVKRAKDGGVTLLIETPGPGKLTAKARGSIPKTAAGKTAKKARASSPAARVSKARQKKKAPSPVLLASASANARSEGTTTLTLHISSKYVKGLKRAGKLKANVTIDFTPPAPTEALSDEVPATFVTTVPAKKSFGKGKGHPKKR